MVASTKSDHEPSKSSDKTDTKEQVKHETADRAEAAKAEAARHAADHGPALKQEGDTLKQHPEDRAEVTPHTAAADRAEIVRRHAYTAETAAAPMAKGKVAGEPVRFGVDYFHEARLLNERLFTDYAMNNGIEYYWVRTMMQQALNRLGPDWARLRDEAAAVNPESRSEILGSRDFPQQRPEEAYDPGFAPSGGDTGDAKLGERRE